jgi:hypothetical protein
VSRLSRQFWILNISQSYRPSRPVTGIDTTTTTATNTTSAADAVAVTAAAAAAS